MCCVRMGSGVVLNKKEFDPRFWALFGPSGDGDGPNYQLDNLSVDANGTYLPESGHAFGKVDVNVSSGGDSSKPSNNVNFYDYDGTITNSYTKDEFLALSALPGNPSHDGLTAQGWNYSLADAQAYVTKYGKLNVGQMYTTTSGATEIDIELTEGRITPTLGICPKGTVGIDWGDGSTGSVSGSSLTTLVNTRHAYPAPGKYTIKLTGTFGIVGNATYGSQLLWDQKTSANSTNRTYQNAVKAIRIGNGVTPIGSSAFSSCCSLSSVTIPESVTSIGNSAFSNCSSLGAVTIPEGVTSIANNEFQNCYSLNAVTIPEGVTSIGTSAFQYCYSLDSVTIPEGVTSIANNEFQNCSSLGAVTIPESVTSIGTSAFQNCYSLGAVTIPDSVTSIDGLAFQSCYSLDSVTIPENVTFIGNSAFQNCYSLGAVTIPESVTFIGNSTFQSCYSLSSVTIPESVTSIGNSAFQNCYSLGAVTIPESVTSIGTSAFQNCYSMAEYHLNPTTPPTIQSNTFSGIPSDCIIYVPTGSLSAYRSASNWSKYASQMVEE